MLRNPLRDKTMLHMNACIGHCLWSGCMCAEKSIPFLRLFILFSCSNDKIEIYIRFHLPMTKSKALCSNKNHSSIHSTQLWLFHVQPSFMLRPFAKNEHMAASYHSHEPFDAHYAKRKRHSTTENIQKRKWFKNEIAKFPHSNHVVYRRCKLVISIVFIAISSGAPHPPADPHNPKLKNVWYLWRLKIASHVETVQHVSIWLHKVPFIR